MVAARLLLPSWLRAAFAREDAMATKLNKLLKREIDVDGKPYMVTLSPEGVKLTEKGKRLGREHSWKELLGAAGVAAASSAPGAPFGSAG
jgi:hypothetical protein